MELMTDFQWKTLLRMIQEILRGCGSVEAAAQKIEALLNEK